MTTKECHFSYELSVIKFPLPPKRSTVVLKTNGKSKKCSFKSVNLEIYLYANGFTHFIKLFLAYTFNILVKVPYILLQN